MFPGPSHPVSPGELVDRADEVDPSRTRRAEASVSAAAAGDPAATRQLLGAVAPSLLRVVRGVLGAGHPDVEDVVQEALVAFVASLASFRGECGVKHFACRIAVRIAMAARRRARAVRLGQDALELQGDADLEHALTPDEAAISARRRELLRRLLDELPEPQAEALALRVLLGLSMQEVADATGAPLNTVRSRLRLAKEALVKRIDQDRSLSEELEVAGEPHRPAS